MLSFLQQELILLRDFFRSNLIITSFPFFISFKKYPFAEKTNCAVSIEILVRNEMRMNINKESRTNLSKIVITEEHAARQFAIMASLLKFAFETYSLEIIKNIDYSLSYILNPSREVSNTVD